MSDQPVRHDCKVKPLRSVEPWAATAPGVTSAPANNIVNDEFPNSNPKSNKFI